MPVFTETLADNVYRRDGFKPPHPYEIRRVVETPSGFRGPIYRNKESGDNIVAHTGTEFDTDKLRDGLLTDAQRWLMKGNQQLDDARSGGTGHQTSVTVLASPRPAIRWADPHACDLA